MTVLLARADARALPLRDGSVQCCVTSPPYWGLRDYGTPGQIGLEATPEEYVAHMVDVFREVRRVLRDDGVLWLNLGDSYAANRSYQVPDSKHVDVGNNGGMSVPPGLKPKDLVGVPWRVAFALQADGWWLRSDIIWHKPNPMPESVTDRPTRAHEYLFLLTKAERYYYDAAAVKEPGITKYQHAAIRERNVGGRTDGYTTIKTGGGLGCNPSGRNLRSVWTITTKPYKGSHYAVMPEKLVEPCIKAGSRVGDVVLDPFCGTATVARVAIAHGRRAVCFDLSGEYLTKQATKRTHNVQLEMVG